MGSFSYITLDWAVTTGSGTKENLSVTAKLGYGVDRGRDDQLSAYARTGGTELTLGHERESFPAPSA